MKESVPNDSKHSPQVPAALNRFTRDILIYLGCFQKFELFHPFQKKIITHIYIVNILSCILFMRHEHLLSFASMYFWPSLLTSNKAYVVSFIVYKL